MARISIQYKYCKSSEAILFRERCKKGNLLRAAGKRRYRLYDLQHPGFTKMLGQLAARAPLDDETIVTYQRIRDRDGPAKCFSLKRC